MTVYLDNSATTRTGEAAIAAMTRSMREGFYNPSALYGPAMQSEKEMKEAREVLAKAVDADPKHVIFTSGGTESDNLAIFGYAQACRGKGQILYSAAEHAAVKRACVEAASRFGGKAQEIPLTHEGLVDLTALESLLAEETMLICIMQVCNETGVIMPLDEVCALRDRLAPDAAIHVDGVQGFLRVPFSLRKSGVQSYAVSSHKFHGPKGVGALVWKDGFRFKPQMVGGGQQNDLRSGTENTSGIAGMAEAVRAYPNDGYMKMLALKTLLVSLLKEQLPETKVIGLPEDDPSSAGHILSVAFPPVRAETLLHALEGDGIYVGTGSACSSKKGKHSAVLTAMGLKNELMDGAIRISLCPENSEEEIRFAAEKIIAHVSVLRRFARR